jgi:hypothetical protein
VRTSLAEGYQDILDDDDLPIHDHVLRWRYIRRCNRPQAG